MSLIANVLLYIGAILIAFQIIGDIGYISTIVVLPFALPIKPLLSKFTQQHKEKRKSTDLAFRTGYFILFLIVALMLIAVSIALSPVMLVYLFIGRPLLALNTGLNILYRKSLEPWRDMYFSGVRSLLNVRRVKRKVTDEYLWQITKQKEVPFLALFGVVCLTVGFILQFC
jgi:hypothetical protein